VSTAFPALGTEATRSPSTEADGEDSKRRPVAEATERPALQIDPAGVGPP